jgi:hypothetical protein
MRSRRAPWLCLVLGLGLAHCVPALAAETVTVTPPPDVIAGVPFALGVATSTDSASATSLRVFIRPDDGRPCEATATATNASVPKPLEVYDEHRRADPVTIAVQPQPTVGGLRVCAFVELIPAPQTTLSRQDLVVPIRGPRGTLQLDLSTTSPFVGGTFQAHLVGSTEAPDGAVVARAQRGPCGTPGADDLSATGLPAGLFDVRQDVMIAPAGILPDRVCAWLTTAGAVLATGEQSIGPRYDGSLSVVGRRFVRIRTKAGKIVGWVVEIKGRGSGKVGRMDARIARGGSCLATKNFSKGSVFTWQCLLKHPPRSPFVVAVTYVTGLGARRTAPNVTLVVPRTPRRHRH